MSIKLSLDVDYLLGIADIHSGSQFAPLPDGMRLLGGQILRPNEFQRWLNKCWEEWWKWADKVVGPKATSALAILGDTTEGVHHGGRELVGNELSDHIAIAKALLKKHTAGRKLIMVEGTECHDGTLENAIGEALGSIPYRKGEGDKRQAVHSWPQVDLEVRGCHGILRHHIAATVRPYNEASALSAQLGSDRIECVRANQKPPQFLVCAHRHKFGAYTDGDAQVVVLPPWQGLTRHGRKVVPHARCHVGGAILDFRDAGKYNPPGLCFKRFVP